MSLVINLLTYAVMINILESVSIFAPLIAIGCFCESLSGDFIASIEH